ncbi:MAG: hypothetical protein K9W43_01080 [Candidatus Thorarchaeota archaeon]|nr:hypothetical protein [Candidatus Thorarchaeota archaeon]
MSHAVPLKKIRIFGIILLFYLFILLYLMSRLFSDIPISTNLSWILLLLIPVDFGLVFVLYNYFLHRKRIGNPFGFVILLYIFSLNPALFASLLGIIGSPFTLVALFFGFAFSVTDFIFIMKNASRLWETDSSDGLSDEAVL